MLDDRRGVRQALAIAVLGHHHQCINVFETQLGRFIQQILHSLGRQIRGLLVGALDRQGSRADLGVYESLVTVKICRLGNIVDPP